MQRKGRRASLAWQDGTPERTVKKSLFVFSLVVLTFHLHSKMDHRFVGSFEKPSEVVGLSSKDEPKESPKELSEPKEKEKEAEPARMTLESK